MTATFKVSFQGETGSFSESAVFQFFSDAEPVPLRYFSAVFESVSKGETDYGVVPVENSQAGNINDTYDLLLKHDLNIVGETFLKVEHCLMALPGDAIGDIKKIYSHPQALAQCEEFLSSLDAEIVPVYDTAGSAKMIKEEGLQDSAAIAAKRVAQIYGMEILAEGIQTNPRNFTRFFVISREKPDRSQDSKTSLIFRTQNTPGALYQSLGAFANRGLNLTKLESRPAKDTPWEYIFYVDFEGHVDDESSNKALEELHSRCAFLKILGSYPRSTNQGLD